MVQNRFSRNTTPYFSHPQIYSEEITDDSVALSQPYRNLPTYQDKNQVTLGPGPSPQLEIKWPAAMGEDGRNKAYSSCQKMALTPSDKSIHLFPNYAVQR